MHWHEILQLRYRPREINNSFSIVMSYYANLPVSMQNDEKDKLR